MELLYAKKTEERVFEIQLVGAIGEEVDGNYIAADIAFINKNKLADRINLRINSEGGNVVNGIKIIGSIMNSIIPVHTYNDGVSYSMGFAIWITAKLENRHASFFANWMAHAARFLNDEGQIVEPENEDDKSFLDVINNSLTELTLKNLNKSRTEVLKMLSKDTFFTAEQMVNLGFIKNENIIQYDSMPQFKANATIQDKIKTIAAFYSEQSNNLNNNKMTDFKALTAKMQLNPDASAESHVAKYDNVVAEKKQALENIKTLEAKHAESLEVIKESKKEVDTLNAKVKEYEEKEAELRLEAVKAEVDNAIRDGKFKEEDRTEIEAIAIESPKAFKALVSKAQLSVTTQVPDISAQLQGDTLKDIAAKVGLEAKDMNYDNLWKNNPEKLDEIKAEFPKVFAAMESKWQKDNN